MIPIIGIVFAIGLPVYALWRSKRAPVKRPYLYALASFAFCSAAIIDELFTIKRRALSGDFGGILDTIDAVLIICIGLVAFTLLMNAFLLGITWKEKQ